MSKTQEVRYSQGKKDIRQASEFSWEHPVPVDKFWDDDLYPTAGSFLKAFVPEDVAKPLVDPISELESREKL